MANTKSAQKAARQTIRRTAINKSRRSEMRTFVRKVEEALAAKDPKAAAEALARGRAEARARRAERHRSQERRLAQDFAPDQARQGPRKLNALPPIVFARRSWSGASDWRRRDDRTEPQGRFPSRPAEPRSGEPVLRARRRSRAGSASVFAARSAMTSRNTASVRAGSAPQSGRRAIARAIRF